MKDCFAFSDKLYGSLIATESVGFYPMLNDHSLNFHALMKYQSMVLRRNNCVTRSFQLIYRSRFSFVLCNISCFSETAVDTSL